MHQSDTTIIDALNLIHIEFNAMRRYIAARDLLRRNPGIEYAIREEQAALRGMAEIAERHAQLMIKAADRGRLISAASDDPCPTPAWCEDENTCQGGCRHSLHR